MANKNKNKNIAASQVGPSELIEQKDQPPRERPEPRDVREFLGLSAEIAQDTVYVRNSRWPGAELDFPHEPVMRTCEKFFKDAKGGPLYIDEPATKSDLAACHRKAELLAKRGLRYVYIYRENGLDPSLESVLSQLGDERGVA